LMFMAKAGFPIEEIEEWQHIPRKKM
jgi:hypothetical protein